jgi:hypothetical protein
VIGQPLPLPRTCSPLEARDGPTPDGANDCDEDDDDAECARAECAKNPRDHQRRPRKEQRDERARDRALRRQFKPSDGLSNARAACSGAVGRRSSCEAIVEIPIVPIENAPSVPGHPRIVVKSDTMHSPPTTIAWASVRECHLRPRRLQFVSKGGPAR